MGAGRWEMGAGRWEMGDGRWEMGDGRWASLCGSFLRQLVRAKLSIKNALIADNHNPAKSYFEVLGEVHL